MYILIKLIESHIQVELVRYYFCTNVKRCNSPKLLYWIHFWNIYWNTPKYTWQSCLHTICCINVHCFIKCAFVFVSLTFPSSYSLSLSLSFFFLSFLMHLFQVSITYKQHHIKALMQRIVGGLCAKRSYQGWVHTQTMSKTSWRWVAEREPIELYFGRGDEIERREKGDLGDLNKALSPEVGYF